ncbi:hypothetical protein [Lysobacter olei]
MLLLLLKLLNLAACALVCAVALFFYLRHARPACLRHHLNQIGLLAISVGAFASAVATLRGITPDWPSVALHLGVAMFAGKSIWDWRVARRVRLP